MKARRFKLPKLNIKNAIKRKNIHITFKGEKGKVARRIAVAAAILVLVFIIANALRVEPQIMNSAEVLSLKDRGVVAIGVRGDMPCFAQDGEGLEIELAKLLAEKLLPIDSGKSRDTDAYKLVTVNSMTVEPKLDDGTIDIAIAMMKKGASSAYSYSNTYYSDTCRIVLKSNAEPFSVNSLNSAKIGYLGSITTSIKTPIMLTVITDYVESNENITIESDNRIPYASYSDIFAALERGEIDAAVLRDSTINKYKETYNFTITEIIMGSVDYAIACSTDYPAFITVADMMLNEMKENGTLDALIKKYGLE